MDIEQYFTVFKRSIKQNPGIQFVQTPAEQPTLNQIFREIDEHLSNL